MINNTEAVKAQYANSQNMNIRIAIHDKYSTNKTGFRNWIFSNYELEQGMSVLELGCGNADIWKEHEEMIALCGSLVLSDFSGGMLETARATIGERDNIDYKVIDIQRIPFKNEAFDIVIANMMLYHVPNRVRGLSEVKRVLKEGGKFYCATYGIHGILEYLTGLLGKYGVADNKNRDFTLQNGMEILEKHFPKVEKLEYEDSLAVTNVDDMVDYVYSLAGMTSLASVPRETIRETLLRNMQDGVLRIPKEYGMFVAEKS